MEQERKNKKDHKLNKSKMSLTQIKKVGKRRERINKSKNNLKKRRVVVQLKSTSRTQMHQYSRNSSKRKGRRKNHQMIMLINLGLW